MGAEVLSSFSAGHLIADTADDVSVASSHGLQHGELARLAALDCYWSERTALISSHHHRELAATQSAVEQARFSHWCPTFSATPPWHLAAAQR